MEKVESVFIADKDIKPRHAKKKPFNYKPVILGLVIFLLLCAVIKLLFFSSVQSVKVINNSFLSSDYILKTAGISEKDNYYLLFGSSKKKALLENPLIKDVTIRKGSNRSVIIDVTENTVVGYQVDGDGSNANAKLILADGKIIEFSAQYLQNIAVIPLFVNVSDDNCTKIAQELSKLKTDVLSRISEVTTVSFTYDDNMVKLTMDDGYYAYSSINGLAYMNSYIDIIVNDTEQSGKCILILAEYSKAVLTSCDEVDSYTYQTGQD